MKFFPFAFLSVALAMGIVMASHFNIAFNYLWTALPIVLLLIFMLKLIDRPRHGITFLGLILICILGMLRYQQVNRVNLPQELSSHKQLLSLEVVDTYKSSNKYYKYKTRILRATEQDLVAKNLLLYVKKSQHKLHLKDVLLTYARPSFIEPPKNPHQFNYKNFIARKGMHLQSFADTTFNIKHPTEFSFVHAVSVFKEKIKHHLNTNDYSPSSRIFISSLALGDRTDFTQDIQNTLSAAGVMHLFAISGLHIGIVFGLILMLLYPLLHIRHGRSLRIVLALLLIWIFAAFVNFTPSVSRAAFMISFYYLSVLLQRPTHIFHTLFFTAFVLLLINPNNLFDVGFQLSYAAVFFIAWLHKPIRKLLPRYNKPRYNYMFDVLSVTLAAQIGVLPIALFYFNQFSGLFLIGNLLLIPCAIFLVGTSMVTVLLIALNLDYAWYVAGVNAVFNFIYSLIETIASFGALIFDHLSISLLELALLMALIFLLRSLLVRFTWIKTIPVLLVICFFQLSRVYNHYQSAQKRELIVFNQYKGNIIGIRNGHELTIMQEVEDSLKAYNYVIKPYVLKEKIKTIRFYKLENNFSQPHFIKEGNLIKYGGSSFYMAFTSIDSLPMVDYVIAMRGSVQPQHYIHAQTKRVIADGSNYPSVIKRLKEKSDQIYATAHSGAFIFIADSTNR